MPLSYAPALLLQIRFSEIISLNKPVSLLVLLFLFVFSILSWTIIFSKWGQLKRARSLNAGFLRTFRKAKSLEAMALASEQYKDAPAAYVFGFGYEEVARQVKQAGKLLNKPAVERMLQVGVSEEMSLLEKRLNLLATSAAVSPFIGLFGTVLGIIDAFNQLTSAGAASLRAVGPGIADALFATALGLFAAIPAAIFYNHFGHVLKDIGARLDDFSLEFMNLTERTFEE